MSRDIQVNKRQGGYLISFDAMASPCEVLIDTDDLTLAQHIGQLVAQEAWRIQDKYSRYQKDSVISYLNHHAGKRCDLDPETFALLNFAKQCYQLSDGDFDIIIGNAGSSNALFLNEGKGENWQKVEEELQEFKDIAKSDVPMEEKEKEFGDILFALVNYARVNNIQPEHALRLTNSKFERRFKHIEERLSAQDKSFSDVDLEEMDVYWDEAKALE